MCSLSKEQSIRSREAIQNAFFFQNFALLFGLDFLSSIKHPIAKHWHPSCGQGVKHGRMADIMGKN